jgi:hypothetical protein
MDMQSTKPNAGAVTMAHSCVILTGHVLQWPVPNNAPCPVLHVHPLWTGPASIVCNHAVLEEEEPVPAVHVLQIRLVLCDGLNHTVRCTDHPIVVCPSKSNAGQMNIRKPKKKKVKNVAAVNGGG